MKFHRTPGARASQLADLLSRINGVVGGPAPAPPPPQGPPAEPLAPRPAPQPALPIETPPNAHGQAAPVPPRRSGKTARKAATTVRRKRTAKDAPALPGPADAPVAALAGTTPAGTQPSPQGTAAPSTPSAPAPASPSPPPAPIPAAPSATPTTGPSPIAKPAAVPPQGAGGPAAPRDDVGGRLDKLETALASLKDLRDLSEIISVQYNPFLDHPANAPPSRPLEAPAGVPGALPAAAPASPAPSNFPEPAATPPPPMPSPAPSPRQDAQPLHAILPAPAMNTMMEGLEDRSPDGQLTLPGNPSLYSPHTVFATNRPVGGPRETFLAIHWYTYLAEGTDPSIIYLYLDYYQNAGWFGPVEYAWLEQLAHGLAVRRPGAKWSDYGLDSRRLAQNHLRNLRVLDKLFGATLQHGEAQYLQQTLDSLLAEA